MSNGARERAIELAKTKHFGSLGDLFLHLSMEGYSLSEVKSRAVKAELRQVMRERKRDSGGGSVLVFIAIAVLVALIAAAVVLL